MCVVTEAGWRGHWVRKGEEFRKTFEGGEEVNVRNKRKETGGRPVGGSKDVNVEMKSIVAIDHESQSAGIDLIFQLR